MIRLLPALGAVVAAAGQQTPDSQPGAQDVVTLSTDGVHDVTDEGLAFLELETARSTYFVHEPIPLVLRFGFERRFLESELLQLFRRDLDVPAQLQAPWLAELGQLEELGSPGGDAGPSFVLGGRPAAATRELERLRGERPFRVLEIERSLLPTRPGELRLGGALLRFAYATRFREDVFHGRVPEDRREAAVHAEALVLSVEPLPEEGRPVDFSGAVGRFTARAEASPQDLELGGSLELVLHVEGEGSLTAFEPPEVAVDGFQVYAAASEPGPGRVTLTYDLVPLRDGVLDVPPIAVSYFDPGPPAAYRTASTEAIPLVVRAPAEAAATPPAPGGGADGGARSAAAGDGAGPPLAVLVIPGALALALLVWLGRRARARASLRQS